MFKSIKTGVLALILVSVGIAAHAQKKISEGSVTYITDANGSAGETKIEFSGTVSSMKIQAGPASVNIITDQVNRLGLVLVDIPIAQQQLAAKMNKEDMDKEAAILPKFSDFKATGEKQVIAGYNAEKYTFKDDKGGTGEVWSTMEVEIPLNSLTGVFKEVKGTVVKFSNQGVSSTLKSVKEEKIALSITEIPKGYEAISYAELMAMRGGN